jgi:hypothetical protein
MFAYLNRVAEIAKDPASEGLEEVVVASDLIFTVRDELDSDDSSEVQRWDDGNRQQSQTIAAWFAATARRPQVTPSTELVFGAMAIVQLNGYIVDQVPIEQIKGGDTVLSHLPDGSSYTFVVGVKRVRVDKAAGTTTIGLQAASDTDTHGVGLVASVEAPAGTLAHRVIRKA